MLPKLRVGLAPIWGGLFLAVAALDLYIWTLTHKELQLIFAGLMALVGISHLFGVLLTTDGNVIEVKNPLGFTLKKLEIQSPNDLEIEGRKLFVTSDGQRRKVSGLMANGSHWAALATAIAAAKKA
jgi:hypothetical protein